MGGRLREARWPSGAASTLLQFRQLGDIDRDAPGLVLGQQIRRHTSARFILEIDICQRVAVVILDDEAGIVRLFDAVHGGGKRRLVTPGFGP